MITLRSNEAVRVNLQVDAGVIAERNAKQYSKDAESWATGKRDGVNVPSTDPSYENNAKYYAEQAERFASDAEQSAAESGYMFFYIDENGDLIFQRTPNVNVDFYLEDGDLYVTPLEE